MVIQEVSEDAGSGDQTNREGNQANLGKAYHGVVDCGRVGVLVAFNWIQKQGLTVMCATPWVNHATLPPTSGHAVAGISGGGVGAGEK